MSPNDLSMAFETHVLSHAATPCRMDIFHMIVHIDIIRPNVNMRSMTDRDKYILDAAVRLFSRYGVKRTSMGDLAEEAGVARQTLYNAYKNKDDVLRALIRYHTDMAIDEIEAGLDGVQALGDQLDIIFNRMSVAGFDLVQATPNAQDIIEGFNAIGQRELEASAEKFRAVIERILSPHEAALLRSGLTAIGLSDFVQRSAKAASSDARDRDHLIGQLNTLKNLCQVATATDAASLNTMV